MNALVDELKTRARLGLNAIRKGDLGLIERAQAVSGLKHAEPPQWQLRHALTLVARSVGFAGWEHARRVLGGLATEGDDMGSFWHAPRCSSLLNHWFADYASARAFVEQEQALLLLPYRRQFVVAGAEYLDAIGVPRQLPQWHAAARNLVAAYGSPAWLALCRARLAATTARAA